ncbi:MAG: MFS transporter [Catenulispora sp.]|nr:MFS transporter [Catenulispora sp.]
MSTTTGLPPTGAEAKHSPLAAGTLIACCVAVCLAQIGVAIPATLNGLFQQDLHPVGSQLTWISDAFLLPVSVLELTFGVLGDLFGRKRLLVGGALLLGLGEVTSASSHGVHLLWVGQALSGLGAAALFPTSLAMIIAGTRSHGERARLIAVWAGLLSVGGAIAPVLGGFTANYGSWRWSFVVVAGIAGASALLSLLLAKDSRSPEGRSLDLGGQLTIGISLFALLYAVIQGPTDGWGSGLVVAGFVVAAVFLALFVAAERRAASPLLRLGVFANRGFAVASVVAVVGMFSFLGTAYATSIRLGPIQHQSPLRTSVAFLLLNGLTLVLIPVTSRLLARMPARWLLAIGLTLMAAGDFVAATLDTGDLALTSLVLPLGLVGVGFAFTVSSITATAVNTVEPALEGMASATTNQLRDFGFTLGPAVIGAIALSTAASRFQSRLDTSSLDPGLKAAAQHVMEEGGPLAVNSVPPDSPPGHAGPLAFEALGHGYSIGYLVCGLAALASCLLVVGVLRRSDAKTVQ